MFYNFKKMIDDGFSLSQKFKYYGNPNNLSAKL